MNKGKEDQNRKNINPNQPNQPDKNRSEQVRNKQDQGKTFDKNQQKNKFGDENR